MLGLGNYYCGEVTEISKINVWHYRLYYSCIKTLATKYRLTIRQIINKYGFSDISLPASSIKGSRKTLATDKRICVKRIIDSEIK